MLRESQTEEYIEGSEAPPLPEMMVVKLSLSADSECPSEKEISPKKEEQPEEKGPPKEETARQFIVGINNSITTSIASNTQPSINETKNYTYNAGLGISQITTTRTDDGGDLVQDIKPFPTIDWNVISTISAVDADDANAVALINTSDTNQTNALFVDTDIGLSAKIPRREILTGLASATAIWQMHVMVIEPSHVHIANSLIFD